MAEDNRHYTSEFKENAVLLSYKKKSVKETASKLDIDPKYFLNGVVFFDSLKREVFLVKAERECFMKTAKFSN